MKSRKLIGPHTNKSKKKTRKQRQSGGTTSPDEQQKYIEFITELREKLNQYHYIKSICLLNDNVFMNILLQIINKKKHKNHRQQYIESIKKIRNIYKNWDKESIQIYLNTKINKDFDEIPHKHIFNYVLTYFIDYFKQFLEKGYFDYIYNITDNFMEDTIYELLKKFNDLWIQNNCQNDVQNKTVNRFTAIVLSEFSKKLQNNKTIKYPDNTETLKEICSPVKANLQTNLTAENYDFLNTYLETNLTAKKYDFLNTYSETTPEQTHMQMIRQKILDYINAIIIKISEIKNHGCISTTLTPQLHQISDTINEYIHKLSATNASVSIKYNTEKSRIMDTLKNPKNSFVHNYMNELKEDDPLMTKIINKLINIHISLYVIFNHIIFSFDTIKSYWNALPFEMKLLKQLGECFLIVGRCAIGINYDFIGKDFRLFGGGKRKTKKIVVKKRNLSRRV